MNAFNKLSVVKRMWIVCKVGKDFPIQWPNQIQVILQAPVTDARKQPCNTWEGLDYVRCWINNLLSVTLQLANTTIRRQEEYDSLFQVSEQSTHTPLLNSTAQTYYLPMVWYFHSIIVYKVHVCTGAWFYLLEICISSHSLSLIFL